MIGSHGYAVMSLAFPVWPTMFTHEHLPKTWQSRSALKDFSIRVRKQYPFSFFYSQEFEFSQKWRTISWSFHRWYNNNKFFAYSNILYPIKRWFDVLSLKNQIGIIQNLLVSIVFVFIYNLNFYRRIK